MMLHLLTLMIWCFILVQTLKRVSDLCAWHRWQMRATICVQGVLIQWHAALFQSPLIYFTGRAPFTYVSHSSEQHTMIPPVACMKACAWAGLTWRDQGADDDEKLVLWDLSVCEKQGCGYVFHSCLYVQSGQIHLKYNRNSKVRLSCA